MRAQGVLKNSGDSFLWVADDIRRIPLKLEAKVKVGTVVAKLWKVELGTPPVVEANPIAPISNETPRQPAVKVN